MKSSEWFISEIGSWIISCPAFSSYLLALEKEKKMKIFVSSFFGCKGNSVFVYRGWDIWLFWHNSLLLQCYETLKIFAEVGSSCLNKESNKQTS